MLNPIKWLLCCFVWFSPWVFADPATHNKPCPPRNECQVWFDSEWFQLPAHGVPSPRRKPPTACRSNPWVRWMQKHQDVLTAQTPNKISTSNDAYLVDVDRLQTLIDMALQGRLRESTDGLKKLMTKHPEWAELYYDMGIVLDMGGDSEQSLAAFEHALDLCSFNPCRINTKSLRSFIELQRKKAKP